MNCRGKSRSTNRMGTSRQRNVCQRVSTAQKKLPVQDGPKCLAENRPPDRTLFPCHEFAALAKLSTTNDPIELGKREWHERHFTQACGGISPNQRSVQAWRANHRILASGHCQP